MPHKATFSKLRSAWVTWTNLWFIYGAFGVWQTRSGAENSRSEAAVESEPQWERGSRPIKPNKRVSGLQLPLKRWEEPPERHSHQRESPQGLNREQRKGQSSTKKTPAFPFPSALSSLHPSLIVPPCYCACADAAVNL